MRRNNENLLILGGTDLTRRTMRPVPLNEVLGAAVSEVEQYTRISVSDSPELAIQGRIVNDFVHLTAELFENATVYSNPDTDVTVRTAYRRQQLVIEIRDRGVGIDPDDLEEINDRLTRPPEIDVAVSRRMGLFVVGQLALRHQIKVQLSNNDDLEGGVTATVYLSGEHVSQLTPEGPKPMPDMPRADQRDSLTETGSHLGLAAAFGHSGATSDEEPDSAGSAAKPPLLPPLSLDEPEPRTSDPAQSEPEVYPTAAAESAPSAADEAVPTNYSVRLTDSSAVEATEVPSWDESVDRLETPIAPAETPEAPAETRSAAESSAAPLWPSEDVSESFGGTCGVPSDASNDLFHSPFEAEKTTQFARTPDLAFPEDEEPTGSAVSDSPNQYGAAPENPSAGPATPEPAAPAAPAAPATGAAGASASTSSAGVSAGESWDIDDTPTQRLPIYEAVLSQWFRESDVDGQMVSAASNGANQSTDNQPARDQPVRDESTISQPDASQSASPAGDGAERAGRMASAMNQSAGARRQGPGADGAQSDAESEHAPDERAAPSNGSPLSDPPSAGAASGGMPDELGAYPNPPAGPAPAEPVERTESFPPETGLPARPDESAALDASHEPVGTPAGDSLDGHAAPQPDTAASSAESDVDPGWGSADAGWRAAEALLEDEQQQETTAAGLPKRVPKSNLVPGSVESRSKSGARPAPTTSSRSAEDVRGRMSNFQQGIRRGRHSKAEPVSSEPPSRHEEQE